MITISNSINKYKDKWTSFILEHPDGTIFQTHEMYDVYLKTKYHEPLFISAVDDNDNILGVLVAVIQKEHSGILGHFSARSIVWGGPLVKDNNLAVLELLLKEYNKKITSKAIYTQFRNMWNWSLEEKEVFKKNGYAYEEHLDILIDLRKSESELLMEMHKGRRKNIGRAERIPLEFIEISDLHDFDKCIELIKQTYNRVKLPCPNSTYFHTIDRELKDQGKLKKFAVIYQDEIISCRLVLCYKGLIYDWFAGTNENHLDKYPNDFLPWKIFQWGKKNGYDTFDFGGAGKPNKPYGVRDYKLKFGGGLVNYGRFTKTHNLILMKFGKIGMKLYKIIK